MMNSGTRGACARWALATGMTALSAICVVLPAYAQDAAAANRPAASGAVAGPGAATGDAPVPATTPMTDLLTRMDALEAQVARLTAQSEEMANRQHQIEAKLAPADSSANAAPAAAPGTSPPAAPVSAPAPVVARPATTSNLSAMTEGASDRPADDHTAGPAHPTAQRIAAVKAVIKPQTGDAGLDEYSYGFRLYTAKFYPEAAQQLKIYIDKYPQDAHISQARNLLGRAYLDDGKPRDAAPWFLLNYKTDPQGARAADSLLNLAEAMRQSGYNSRACIALNEFSLTYAAEAKGRLHAEYATTRGGLTCN